MKIFFLSCDELAGFVVDDDLLVKELEADGHEVKTFSWREDVDWSSYDCGIIRTTWDYMKYPEEFYQKLEMISKQTKLLNPLSTIKWNIYKSYLKNFQDQGVRIVPTVFFSHKEGLKIPESWPEKVVVKPVVSAGAYKTMVLSKEEATSLHLTEGDWMCQPFLPQIKDGEYSLIYFNKKFSHALVKVPKAGDFRVQEEFGGDIIPVNPTPEMLSLSDSIMNVVKEGLLYARVDLVPYEGDYALMELELIEPALYFRTNKESPRNFKQALYAFLKANQS